MSEINQHRWHQLLLWKGKPIYLTPEQRAKLEPKWLDDPRGCILKVGGTTVTGQAVVGFQETDEFLPDRLLSHHEPKQIDEPAVDESKRAANLARYQKMKLDKLSRPRVSRAKLKEAEAELEEMRKKKAAA